MFQYYSDIYYNLNYKEKSYIKIFPIKRENVLNNLILCGNIGKPTSKKYWKFIQNVSKVFDNIFLVPSDAELEGLSHSYIDALIQCNISALYLKNVFYLNDSSVLIKGCKIVGGYKYTKKLKYELSEKRVPCILITGNKPEEKEIDALYCIYGNTYKNYSDSKFKTNQYGKNWYKHIEGFKHDAHIIVE